MNVIEILFIRICNTKWFHCGGYTYIPFCKTTVDIVVLAIIHLSFPYVKFQHSNTSISNCKGVKKNDAF